MSKRSFNLVQLPDDEEILVISDNEEIPDDQGKADESVEILSESIVSDQPKLDLIQLDPPIVPPAKKIHHFFMSPKQRKEQKLIEKRIKLAQDMERSNQLTRAFNKGKDINPFFNQKNYRATSIKKTTKEELVPAPYPTSEQFHVGWTNKKNVIEPLPIKTKPIWIPDLDLDCFPLPRHSDSPSRTSIEIFSHQQAAEEIRVLYNQIQESYIDDEMPHSLLTRLYEDFNQGLSSGSGLWTELYRPAYNEFIGPNQASAQLLLEWLLEWTFRPPRSKRRDDESDEEDMHHLFACIMGPCQSGKTTMAWAVAIAAGYHVLEVSSSTKRSGKELHQIISEAMSSQRIKENTKTLILLDDVDVLLNDDKGFWTTLSQLIPHAKCPMILTYTSSFY